MLNVCCPSMEKKLKQGSSILYVSFKEKQQEELKDDLVTTCKNWWGNATC